METHKICNDHDFDCSVGNPSAADIFYVFPLELRRAGNFPGEYDFVGVPNDYRPSAVLWY